MLPDHGSLRYYHAKDAKREKRLNTFFFSAFLGVLGVLAVL
jgi:hypothetical protein